MIVNPVRKCILHERSTVAATLAGTGRLDYDVNVAEVGVVASEGWALGATGNYTLAVLAGWIVATWALCSVLFSASAKFRALGRSKWRWFLVALLAFFPYLGFIAVLFYIFKVRVHFPPTPKPPPPMRQAPAERTFGTGPGTPADPAWRPAPHWTPPKVKCSCGDGKVQCYQCSNGYVYNGSQIERHHYCSGTGKLKCQMCNGTGYR
jgi:hypothetical protein